MNIVITGANSGLGFEATRYCAAQGHTVVMAVRNLTKGEIAKQNILTTTPTAELILMELNLASLESIRQFSDEISKRLSHIDILCNNAGVMVPPFAKTTDGFELQIGTNFLGHYALTAQLLPLLKKSDEAKVITTSSVAKWFGWIRPKTFTGDRHYRPWLYYGQSKYADYLFFKSLQDYLEEQHIHNIRSLGVHPGVAKTNLTARGTGEHSARLVKLWNLIGQDGTEGALTLIEAIDNPHLKGRDYVIPDGRFQFKGKPMVGRWLCRRYNKKTAALLWKTAEQLSGVVFPK